MHPTILSSPPCTHHSIRVSPHWAFVHCLTLFPYLPNSYLSFRPQIQAPHLSEKFTYYILSKNHLRQLFSVCNCRLLQFSSVAQLCLTLCDPMDCSMPGLPIHTNSQSWLKLTSIELVMPYNYFILYHPLLLPSLVFPSIRVFSKESVLRIRWPEYWSLSFNISPSNEHSGLISFRMDWLDLLEVQGTLKSLLQTIVQKHQFFSAWLSL